MALFISVLHGIIHFACTREYSIIDTNSFISSCIGLLSIIVVLAVGWQIYNAIDVKERLKQIQALYDDLPFLIQARTDFVKAIGIFRCGAGRNEAEALKIGIKALQNAVRIKGEEKNQTVQDIIEFIKNDVIPTLTHGNEIDALLNVELEISRMHRFIGYIDLQVAIQNKISELRQRYPEK